jgi:hypothetical protein
VGYGWSATLRRVTHRSTCAQPSPMAHQGRARRASAPGARGLAVKPTGSADRRRAACLVGAGTRSLRARSRCNTLPGAFPEPRLGRLRRSANICGRRPVPCSVAQSGVTCTRRCSSSRDPFGWSASTTCWTVRSSTAEPVDRGSRRRAAPSAGPLRGGVFGRPLLLGDDRVVCEKGEAYGCTTRSRFPGGYASSAIAI